MEVCMRLGRILRYFYNYSIFDLVYFKKICETAAPIMKHRKNRS